MTRRPVHTSDMQRIRELAANGVRDAHIAAELGFGRRTVGKIRASLGIPGHGPGRPRNDERSAS